MSEEARQALEKLVYEGDGFVDVIIYVKPEQPEAKLTLEYGDLVFYSTEPPVAGRANAELVRYLASILGVPTSRIEIIYGARSTTKRVRIYEVDRETVIEALLRALGKT